MHRIHYAGDSIVTGTAIARALLDYAQALSQVGASATVEVPTIEPDGGPGRAELLIGPASQLSAHEERYSAEELTDDELVERMRAEANRLRHFGSPTPPVGVVPADTIRMWTDLEEL